MVDYGLIGAIVGGSIGIAGGAFGTWMSIRNARPGPHRALMVKASVFFWIFTLTFVAMLLLLPTPWTWWLWVLYGPALLFFILSINKALADLETTAQQPTTD